MYLRVLCSLRLAERRPSCLPSANLPKSRAGARCPGPVVVLALGEKVLRQTAARIVGDRQPDVFVSPRRKAREDAGQLPLRESGEHAFERVLGIPHLVYFLIRGSCHLYISFSALEGDLVVAPPGLVNFQHRGYEGRVVYVYPGLPNGREKLGDPAL